METVFHHVFNVILPILLCIFAGFALAKLKQPFDNKMVTSVMANVGYPTLILSHLLGHPVNLPIFLQMLAAALAAVLCLGAIWACLLRLAGLSIKVFLSTMSLNNVGNVGLPVCLLAVGAGGITYGLAFVVVTIVVAFTVGQWITSGNYSMRNVLTSPVVYASILAVVMLLNGLSFPKPLMDSLNILGGLAIPLMLLTLGHSLATLQFGRLGLAVKLSLLHVVVAAAVAFALVTLFGFTGAARSVFILQCLMPASAATYLWVEMYCPDDAPGVAGVILVTTLLTMVVLPLVLAYWI